MAHKHVLIAIGGLTPQVVTETIWALDHRQPSILVDEIQILTTVSGKETCLKTLCGSKGALYRYWKEFHPGTPPPSFGKSHILTFRDSSGAPLDDLRSEEDNRVVADQIAKEIWRQTRRQDVTLHCSVAGGRKTMGILLAAALQLYGRPEDRLYHVLVSAEFESHPEFFYKPRRPRKLSTPRGPCLDTKHASIELAEIPYIRLREFLPDAMLEGAQSFTQLVSDTQRHLELHLAFEPLVFHLRTHRVSIGKQAIKLTPSLFSVYLALARLKTRQCVKPENASCLNCTACFPVLSPETWEEERSRLCMLIQAAPTWTVRSFPKTLEQFRSAKAKIHKELRETLGSERLATRYRVIATGERYAKAYGLAVDKTAIQENTE